MENMYNKEKTIKEINDRISRNEVNLMLSDLVSDIEMYTDMINSDRELLDLICTNNNKQERE